MDWSSFLIGLAVLPALGLLYLAGAAAMVGPGKTWTHCKNCRREWHPRRFDTWWSWKLWERHQWNLHMRRSVPCREWANKWLLRRDRHEQYNSRGRLKKVT
jgi:hypothetical protein